MKNFNLKSNKGITLIALIITIIVLLILAGVTINAITGNESAMDKAKQAKSETTIAEAKESAVLKATALIQDYMDKRYVQNDTTLAGKSIGEYVAVGVDGVGGMNGVTEGNYKFVATKAGALSVFDKDADTLTDDEAIVKGTIDSTTGKITWGTQTGNNPADNPDSVYSRATKGDVTVGQKIGNYVPQDKQITNDDLNLPAGASIERRKLASIAGVHIYNSDNNANKITDWVVLDVNKSTGEVLIVPDTTSVTNSYVYLGLSGMDGYNNSEKALNLVAGMYTDSNFAESARSITVGDINNLEDYTPNGEVKNLVFSNDYGMNDNLDIVYQGGNTTEISTETDDLEQGGKKTITLNYKVYKFTPTTEYYTYSIDQTKYGFLCGSNNFWLASRCVNLDSSNCYFDVRYLSSGNVGSGNLFHVGDYGLTGDNNGSIGNYYVLPVVSLKSGINMTWDDTNGAWNLSE